MSHRLKMLFGFMLVVLVMLVMLVGPMEVMPHHEARDQLGT